MKIAIIAGSGDFPVQIAKENPDVFVLCIKGHSFTSSFKNNSEYSAKQKGAELLLLSGFALN